LDPDYYYYSLTNPGGCNCPPTCTYGKILKSLLDGGYNSGVICFNNSCELVEDTLCCNITDLTPIDPCNIPDGAEICEFSPPTP
jgi:hypothetical protein